MFIFQSDPDSCSGFISSRLVWQHELTSSYLHLWLPFKNAHHCGSSKFISGCPLKSLQHLIRWSSHWPTSLHFSVSWSPNISSLFLGALRILSNTQLLVRDLFRGTSRGDRHFSTNPQEYILAFFLGNNYLMWSTWCLQDISDHCSKIKEKRMSFYCGQSDEVHHSFYLEAFLCSLLFPSFFLWL